MIRQESKRSWPVADDRNQRTIRGVRVAIGIAAFACTLALSGCATPVGDPSVASTQPATEPGATRLTAPAATPGVITDAVTCTGIGDVVSVRFNADVAVSEGRMDTTEQAGWYRVATIMLSRVPTRGDGAVSESVATLQSLVPSVPLAAMGGREIASDDTTQEWDAVFDSCAEAGAEIATVSFTGG